jgi:hypothetical protein
MAEYKVLKVSQEPPREHTGDYGTTYYIKVMLEGHDRPVSIGKKDPNALKAGDVVSGTITETQYDADKFTAEKKQFGGGGHNSQPRDDEDVRIQWALGRSYEKHGASDEALKDAKWLLDSHDKLKGKEVVTEAPKGYEAFKASRPQPKEQDVVHQVVDESESEEVNLDDISF